MDQPSSTDSNAITLRIKFKSASLDDFINRYGVDVSPGGLFIRTKQPVEVGTTLQFDFTLVDGSPLLVGLGTVAWVRESDPSRANNVPGMGLRFDKLTPESQHTHQLILSEKARKEGKSLSTPYPPTAVVAPAAKPPSPTPDDLRTAAEIAAKMGQGPADLAVTRPAPSAAVKPAPFAAVAPTAPAAESSGDTDEFASAGKTEISDKPLDFYLKEAAREAEERQTAIDQPPTPEEAVPSALIEDFNSDPESLPSTKSGPPPAGYDLKDSSPMAAAEAPDSVKPLSEERKTGGREALTSLLGLGASDGSVAPNAAVSSEVLDEISSGAPIEETASEKTEEVSLEPAKLLADVNVKAPEPFDLTSSPLDGDRAPSRDNMPSLKPKGSGKLIAGIALLAAAAAFGAVYLAKTKPWQQENQAEPAPVAVASPAPAPIPAVQPAVPAPEPAKPVAPEEAVAKKPAAEEAKPVVAEKTEPEKLAAEKPVAEKAGAAKTEPESAASKPASKSGGKAGTKTSDEKVGEQKAGDNGEEAYRLVFKSSPIGAEVLIDGEYFARTPCERRILDPKKSFAITIRREGYEPHERLLGASDNWVKKGNERVLNVTVNLKKSSAASAGAASGSTEAKPAAAKAPEAAKPESKPAVAPPEPVKPAAPKPDPTKPEPAKAAPAPAEKSTPFKPVPNFDEPSKAKE